MELQPKHSETKRCVETIPYFSMFWDVRRELASLSVLDNNNQHFSGLQRSCRQCCLRQSRNQIVGNVCVGSPRTFVPSREPPLLAGQRSSQTGAIFDPVRPEILQPCLEKPKTFSEAKQKQPAIQFQFAFPDEAKLQDDVASVTSSQFCLVAPFKPGCLHVYSRGVKVPRTNLSSNHLKTGNISSIVERNGPSERLVIPLTFCCQPLDTT